MPHALVELGACAGFSQGYSRGLCGEEREKETTQQQSARNTVSTALFFLPPSLREKKWSTLKFFPVNAKTCVPTKKKNTCHDV